MSIHDSSAGAAANVAAGRVSGPRSRLTLVCLALAVAVGGGPVLAQDGAPPPRTEVPTSAPVAPPPSAVAPSPTAPTAVAPPSATVEPPTTTPAAAPAPAEAIQPAAEAAPTPSAEPTPVGEPASPVAVPAAGIDRIHLPTDLSPWGMFMAADIVVKTVMIGLVAASLAVWTVWLAKIMELIASRLALRRGLLVLGTETTLDGAAARMTRRTSAARAMVRAAQYEMEMSHDVLIGGNVKERVGSRLAEIESALGRRMRRGMGLLATVGATAPFIGLFGTVWGIMNSFIGISKSQTTSLAVVAPGIAEALLATAIGLIAAIPAVILYNQLSRSIVGYRAVVRETSGEVERLVSREIDRRSSARPAPALVRRG